MSKLLKHLSKIYYSFQKIMNIIFKRATKGAGITVQTIGQVLATVVAIIAMIFIILAIVIAAIPIGIFSPQQQDVHNVATEVT